MVFGLALVIALYSCGGEGQENKTDKVEGRFDVGDHKMWMRCEGEGSPTIVYFHGFIEDPPGGASNADRSSRCSPTSIGCASTTGPTRHERRRARAPDGQELGQGPPQPPRGARVEPPYVLLGASFGGLRGRLRRHLSRRGDRDGPARCQGPRTDRTREVFPQRGAAVGRGLGLLRREDRSVRRLHVCPQVTGGSRTSPWPTSSRARTGRDGGDHRGGKRPWWPKSPSSSRASTPAFSRR